MSYSSDPELIFLKWAYKSGSIDDDGLHDIHVRARREAPGRSYLELLVEWEYMTQDEIDALLTPEAVRGGVDAGLIDEVNAASLEALMP